MAQNNDAQRLLKFEEKGNFEYYVAIDFGTHGTGLGYAIKKGEKTYCNQDWNEKKEDTKNKTDILLTYDGQFVAFGYNALEKYKHQDDPDSDDSDTDGSDDDEADGSDTDEDEERDEDDEKSSNKINTNHMLFESFKMALYENKGNSKDGDIRSQIPCADGRLCSTSTVFVEALKFMKRSIFKTFKQKGIALKEGNSEDLKKIQWILTVPAIWSDRAKHKMEVWATSAGLITGKITNHIRIVYEPDCASISCQYETADEYKKKQKLNGGDNDEKEDKFKAKERYILIDAGGGTVDIACHEVVHTFQMKEIHHPSGGPWGSDFIDKNFENFLCEIFEQDTIREYKKKHPHSYTIIKDNFRDSKCTFFKRPNDKHHKVKLVADFISFVATYTAKKIGTYNSDEDDDDDDENDEEEEFNKMVENARPFGLKRGSLFMEGPDLNISTKIWKEHLFDKVINPLINHVKDLLDNKVDNIKYLMLAGGLSASKYFQERIHQTLGRESSYKLAVKIPKRPILSVIDGALKLGLKPNYISGRCLQYTYGIAVDRSVKNVKFEKLPKGYADKNSYIHPNTNKRTIKGLFSAFAKVNQSIKLNDTITKQYRRFHRNEKKCNISIYYSPKPEPYIVEGKPLASVPIIFDDDDDKLKFNVKFYFGDTKIRATAKGKELKLIYHYYETEQ